MKIGGMDYEIKRWSQLAAENSNALGMCDRVNLTILIREDMVPQKMAEVLVHEIVHAIYDNMGLSYHREEEPIVNALGYGLVQVWRDNPHVVAWIEGTLRR